MSKEKDIVVSGIMFLVGMEAYKSLVALMSYSYCQCGPVTTFMAYLVAGTLVAASAISITVSFGYFKRFSHKACHHFMEDDEEEEE